MGAARAAIIAFTVICGMAILVATQWRTPSPPASMRVVYVKAYPTGTQPMQWLDVVVVNHSSEVQGGYLLCKGYASGMEVGTAHVRVVYMEPEERRFYRFAFHDADEHGSWPPYTTARCVMLDKEPV